MLGALGQLLGPRVTLGRTGWGYWRPYRIPVAARHTYVIGSTGTGKSKFLEHLMVQDIVAGRGVGLIDPHSDLARDLLAHLATIGFFNDEANAQRIIYLDPTRSDFFLPFNILKSDWPPYVVTQMVIESFRRTWPTTLAEAPRFSNIALMSLLVLMDTNQTLVQLPRLLTDVAYRKQLLTRVKDQELVDFFNNRFDRWGRDVAVMIEPVLNKVTAFTFNPYLKRLLGSSDNRLDFKRIMDSGQTLIVDLGGCDGETRRLLGSLIVTGMEQAALTRREGVRRPYHLYIDEFAQFSAGAGGAKTLSTILSEARKFGLFLHLSHQTIGQLNDQLISALGNVGIKVVFQVEREDAEVMAKRQFVVDPEWIKHPPQTEVQIPLYSPVPEQWEKWVAELQNLKPRQAWVKQRGKPAVKIKTERIKPYRVSVADLEQLKSYLAGRHGVAADQEMAEAGEVDTGAIGPADWERRPCGGVVYQADLLSLRE